MRAFVERRFELGDGSEVVVRFARPMADGADFRCDYEIMWPDRRRASKALGIDGVQALTLAMAKAHVDLLASPEGRTGHMRWFGAIDLGLPLPEGLAPKDFTRRRGPMRAPRSRRASR